MVNRIEVDGFIWEIIELPEPMNCRYPVATKIVCSGDRGCSEAATMLARYTSPDGELREWPLCPAHGVQWAARYRLER